MSSRRARIADGPSAGPAPCIRLCADSALERGPRSVASTEHPVIISAPKHPHSATAVPGLCQRQSTGSAPGNPQSERSGGAEKYAYSGRVRTQGNTATARGPLAATLRWGHLAAALQLNREALGLTCIAFPEDTPKTTQSFLPSTRRVGRKRDLLPAPAQPILAAVAPAFPAARHPVQSTRPNPSLLSPDALPSRQRQEGLLRFSDAGIRRRCSIHFPGACSNFHDRTATGRWWFDHWLTDVAQISAANPNLLVRGGVFSQVRTPTPAAWAAVYPPDSGILKMLRIKREIQNCPQNRKKKPHPPPRP